MSDERKGDGPRDQDAPRSVWDDPELFADGGEELLDQLRALDEPVPSQKLGASLRARVVQRSRRLLRARNLGDHLSTGMHAIRLTARRSWAFRLALLGVLLSVGFLLGRQLWRSAEQRRVNAEGQMLVERARESGELGPGQDTSSGVASSSESEATGALPVTEADRQAWLRSENELRRLRELFDERATPEYQRRLLQIAGVDVRVQRRIGYLAGWRRCRPARAPQACAGRRLRHGRGTLVGASFSPGIGLDARRESASAGFRWTSLPGSRRCCRRSRRADALAFSLLS